MAVTFIGGIGTVWPWRSAAEAAKSERDSLRERTERLEKQNEQQAREISELKRTDMKVVVSNQTTIIRTLEVVDASLQGLSNNLSMIGTAFIEHTEADKEFAARIAKNLEAIERRINNGGSK